MNKRQKNKAFSKALGNGKLTVIEWRYAHRKLESIRNSTFIRNLLIDKTEKLKLESLSGNTATYHKWLKRYDKAILKNVMLAGISSPDDYMICRRSGERA